jgi:hypothetical protein
MLRLPFLLACAAVATAEADVYVPEEDDHPWHDRHIEKVSIWSIDACDHILTARAGKGKDPCGSFASEHAADFMSERAKRLGEKFGQKMGEAMTLCHEVEHILAEVTDDEIAHIPQKMEYKTYCKQHFALDTDGHDFFAKLKHVFVLGKRHPDLATREEL